jgi:hypothetical protein
MTILLQHVTIEEVTLQWVVVSGEILDPFNPERRLLIHGILSLRISSADGGVIGSREEVVANACAGVVMCIGSITWALLRWLPARALRWSSGIGLLKSV